MPQGSDPALASLGLSRSVMMLEVMNSSHFFCQGPHYPSGELGEGKGCRFGPLSWVPVAGQNQDSGYPWAWPSMKPESHFQQEMQHQH